MLLNAAEWVGGWLSMTVARLPLGYRLTNPRELAYWQGVEMVRPPLERLSPALEMALLRDRIIANAYFHQFISIEYPTGLIA